MRSELVEAKGGWRTRGRADDALELLDHGLVVESIGLLVVAEHNLSLWEQLRIANLRQREPEHLESVVEDAWATLRAHEETDQALLADFGTVVNSLTTPARHDGLAPIQSQRLTRASDHLDDLAAWFAEQRTLDQVLVERVTRPGLKDSLTHLAERTVDTASGLLLRIRGKRKDGDTPPELPSSSQSPIGCQPACRRQAGTLPTRA